MSSILAAGAPEVPPLQGSRAAWSTGFDEAAYRGEAAQSNADLIPKPLRLRVHAVRSGQLERLVREIELAGQLFDRDRDVIALQVDAARIAAPAMRDLEVLIASLDRHFHFAPGARRRHSIRLPAAAARPDDLGACQALGFDSMTFVTDRANDATVRAVDMARHEGMHSVTVEATLPDHHVPDALLASLPEQLTLGLPKAATFELDLEQLERVATRLADAGYGDIGLDPRPLPWFEPGGSVELRAATRGARPSSPDTEVDLVGLGPGAMSRVRDALCENFPDEKRWRGAVDAAVLPLWRGVVLDADERLRSEVIGELLRRGEVAIDAIARRHDIDFHRYFERELAQLGGLFGGLVRVGPWRFETTSQGRLALRIIAACFEPVRANPIR